MATMIFDLLGLCLLIFGFWTPTAKSLPLKKKGVCMIVSEPDGAEIWINQKKTKWVTPALVQLPLNAESEVHLKKDHYKIHQAWIRSSHELSFYYRALEKIKLVVIHSSSSEGPVGK